MPGYASKPGEDDRRDGRIVVEGGHRLTGSVRVSSSKNAILPIIAASLLADGPVTLEDTPPLTDVLTMCALITSLGARADRNRRGDLTIHAGSLESVEPPSDLVALMRASLLVLGPLLARKGRAESSMPGGCAIGSRPIDLHLKGFEALGARVTSDRGRIEMWAPSGLSGARIYLDFPSVTATENILMAACLADGQTLIENAAEEPEVVDLASCLNAMGARIRGAGTKLIKVEGVRRLHGATYRVIPDRIEAGTYMVAAAITRGDVLVEGVVVEHLKPITAKLREAGVLVEEESADSVRVVGKGRPRAVDVKTLPYPGFPTDMQAPLMALLALADGTSIVTETVFENRFGHVDGLKRIGADIRTEGRSAIIRGVQALSGSSVAASDLRAGAALVLAALAAEGRSEVSGLAHIERGYADLVGKLRGLGAGVRVELQSPGD